MKKIYICHTEYHVLITLIKNINNSKEKNDIVLYGTLKNVNKVYKKIKETDLFDNVYIFNYRDTEEVEKIPETKNVILRRIRLKKWIKEKYNFDFLKNKEVYIFNDNSLIGMFLRLSKINYNIIEDGYDCYKHIERHYDFNGIKYKIKILINDITNSFGTSKYVKQIEVNSLEGINLSFKNKFIEKPRKEIFDKLDNKQKKIIIDVFLDKPLDLSNKEVSLLITQPLYKDGFLDNEEQQIKMYKYMLETYIQGDIIIKPHPRDETNYLKVIKDCIVLNSDFPIEILNLMDGIHIKKCITAFSTSVDFITRCDEKIVLGSEWVKKYKNGEINGKK